MMEAILSRFSNRSHYIHHHRQLMQLCRSSIHLNHRFDVQISFYVSVCLDAGCEVLIYTSEGVVCQLPLELVAGIYRVVLWDPARGYGDQMPLLTVTASITAISPNISQSTNLQLIRQKKFAHEDDRGAGV